MAELLQRVGDSPLADYMVIIDDASTDGTRQFLGGFAAQKDER